MEQEAELSEETKQNDQGPQPPQGNPPDDYYGAEGPIEPPPVEPPNYSGKTLYESEIREVLGIKQTIDTLTHTLRNEIELPREASPSGVHLGAPPRELEAADVAKLRVAFALGLVDKFDDPAPESPAAVAAVRLRERFLA